MKNLFKILIFLFITFLFSVGERKNKDLYTISKINSFSQIVGWNNIQGNWKSKENKIVFWDSIRDEEKLYGRLGLGNSNIIDISTYTIKQHPNLILISFTYKDGFYRYPSIREDWTNTYETKVIVVEKINLIKLLKFDDKKLSLIDLPVGLLDNPQGNSPQEFSVSFYTSEDELEEQILNYIKSKLPIYFQPKESDYWFESKQQYLKICYYKSENTIQYMIGLLPKKTIVSDLKEIDWFETVTGDYILIDYYDISDNPNISEYMNYRYFESPFNEFKKIFLNN
tara:strand:- start:597 stop:1445 length:849 start_codon:yes stop_codon:yes gene_type:complete